MTKTKDIVEKLLKEDERCRNDDKWLCYRVWEKICKKEGEAIWIPFNLFNKLPAFETISRMRRFIRNNENKYNEKIEEQPKHNYKMVKEVFVKHHD